MVNSRRILLVSIFLTVIGARGWWVHQYTSACPVWDQWDAEALGILVPWLQGKLTFGAFLIPHNEHPVALTRLTAFLLYLVNGQWDPRVEVLTSVILSGLIAAWFFWALVALAPESMDWLLVVAILLAFCLPFDWGNMLFGFQSAFYYLVGTSLIALWGLTTGRTFSARWWVGVFCMVLTLGTMGSGLLAAVCLFVVLLVRALLRRNKRAIRSELPTLLLCLVVATIGWLRRRTPPLTFHWPQPESPWAFIRALLRNLAWPLPAWLWMAFVFWLPYLMLTKTMITDAEKREDKGRLFLFALGSWIIFQSISLAVYRAGYGEPASRYLAVLVVGTLCNLVCWMLLLSNARRPGLVRGGMAIWGLLAVIAILRIARENLVVELPPRMPVQRTQELGLRAFVATGDLRVFEGKDITEMAFPVPKHLADILSQPGMRDVLPPDVRDVDHIDVEVGEGFIADGVPATVPLERGRPSWGSYAKTGVPAIRRFVSKPFEPTHLPFLRFDVSGYLGEPGTSLKLVDRDGREYPIRPSQLAPEGWSTVEIPLRGIGPFRLLARDESVTHWFAFRGPYAVGVLSHYAPLLASASWLFFWLGLGGVTGSVILRKARAPRDPFTKTNLTTLRLGG